ncbi:hypothetical protein LDENG_00260990, partial [Lucifuga dentata]
LIDGQLQHVTVGHFSSFVNKDYKLKIHEENIEWRTGKVVPKSVCSNVCPMFLMFVQLRENLCCFDCIPCADGAIANST